VSGSLVVETLHFADGSIANLADCFLRTKPRRWRIRWRIKPCRRMRRVASDGYNIPRVFYCSRRASGLCATVVHLSMPMPITMSTE